MLVQNPEYVVSGHHPLALLAHRFCGANYPVAVRNHSLIRLRL